MKHEAVVTADAVVSNLWDVPPAQIVASEPLQGLRTLVVTMRDGKRRLVANREVVSQVGDGRYAVAPNSTGLDPIEVAVRCIAVTALQQRRTPRGIDPITIEGYFGPRDEMPAGYISVWTTSRRDNTSRIKLVAPTGTKAVHLRRHPWYAVARGGRALREVASALRDLVNESR